MSATSPPPAPTPMSGADILVQCLINHGVDVVFAYPGGASMPIHQALTKVSDQLRTILPRHEQGGGFAAEGYARSTGKVGVCIATSGPGATNFVTCLADAKMDSMPIIAITGQVGTAVIGTDAFQETPIVEVCRAITKHHYLVTRTEDIAARHEGSVPHRHHRPARPGHRRRAQGRAEPADRARLGSADEPARLQARPPGDARANWSRSSTMIRSSKKPIIYARRRHHRSAAPRRT